MTANGHLLVDVENRRLKDLTVVDSSVQPELVAQLAAAIDLRSAGPTGRIEDEMNEAAFSGAADPLAVGRQHTFGPRLISAALVDQFAEVSGDAHPMHSDSGDGAPVIAHGVLGVAVATGFIHESGLFVDTIAAMLDARFQFIAPIVVGDEITMTMTITRRRRTSRGDRIVIERHIVLNNQHGAVVQEGDSACLITAFDARPEIVDLDFGSSSWATAVADRLVDDPTFADATMDFDGTIALGADGETAQFRIYRGRIIDVARRTPCGPTFTVSASRLEWLNLVRAPRNDFFARIMGRRFHASGNTFEYLRMTKALAAMVDAVRAVGAEAQR